MIRNGKATNTTFFSLCLSFNAENNSKCKNISQNPWEELACEQAFGRAGNWGKGKVKRPVDNHLGPPFHGTCCASDLYASSFWREH